jgi:hypothetical protein
MTILPFTWDKALVSSKLLEDALPSKTMEFSRTMTRALLNLGYDIGYVINNWGPLFHDSYSLHIMQARARSATLLPRSHGLKYMTWLWQRMEEKGLKLEKERLYIFDPFEDRYRIISELRSK